MREQGGLVLTGGEADPWMGEFNSKPNNVQTAIMARKIISTGHSASIIGPGGGLAAKIASNLPGMILTRVTTGRDHAEAGRERWTSRPDEPGTIVDTLDLQRGLADAASADGKGVVFQFKKPWMGKLKVEKSLEWPEPEPYTPSNLEIDRVTPDQERQYAQLELKELATKYGITLTKGYKPVGFKDAAMVQAQKPNAFQEY